MYRVLNNNKRERNDVTYYVNENRKSILKQFIFVTFLKRLGWNYFNKITNKRKSRNSTKRKDFDFNLKELSYQASSNLNTSQPTHRWSKDLNLISWTNLTLFDEYLEMGWVI